jgi:hypothetical protein
MTISRKLLLIATLGIATQSCVQAYDVIWLKKEVKTIINFIPRVRTYQIGWGGHIVPYGIARWLENKLYHIHMTSNNEIITIVNAINKDDVFTLRDMMESDKQFEKNAIKSFARTELNPYISQAQKILYRIRPDSTHSLSDTHSMQKKAIKNIAKKLHQLAKELKRTNNHHKYLNYLFEQQLYKRFKKDVYKVWKKTGVFPALQ